MIGAEPPVATSVAPLPLIPVTIADPELVILMVIKQLSVRSVRLFTTLLDPVPVMVGDTSPLLEPEMSALLG